jgi:hypothetical protein
MTTTKTQLPTIIAITGRMRNGKDTLADYLIKKYCYQQLAFAEPIKQICMILYGFTQEQCYGNLKETLDKRWGITPRQAFQFIGTELFRKQMKNLLPNIEDNFWVKVLQEKIKQIYKENSNTKFVISDVRFFNELEGLRTVAKELGVSIECIRVTRPDINSTDKHESEIYIDQLKVDHDLINNKQIQDLHDLFESKVLNNNSK